MNRCYLSALLRQFCKREETFASVFRFQSVKSCSCSGFQERPKLLQVLDALTIHLICNTLEDQNKSVKAIQGKSVDTKDRSEKLLHRGCGGWGWLGLGKTLWNTRMVVRLVEWKVLSGRWWGGGRVHVTDDKKIESCHVNSRMWMESVCVCVMFSNYCCTYRMTRTIP